MVPLINMEEFLCLRLHPHTITPDPTELPVDLPLDSQAVLGVILETMLSAVLHHCGVKNLEEEPKGLGVFVTWAKN